MKKVTVTETVSYTGFDSGATSRKDSDNGTAGSTVTDYVSDSYTSYDYWQDRHLKDFLVDHEEGAVNYTLTLRDIRRHIEDLATELENMWQILEVHSTLIESDATLTESDRDALTGALDEVVHSLSVLGEECDEPVCCVDNALDAFDHLTIAE